MLKLIVGIILGIVLITYYPQIGSVLGDLFTESGMRDDSSETFRRDIT